MAIGPGPAPHLRAVHHRRRKRLGPAKHSVNITRGRLVYNSQLHYSAAALRQARREGTHFPGVAQWNPKAQFVQIFARAKARRVPDARQRLVPPPFVCGCQLSFFFSRTFFRRSSVSFAAACAFARNLFGLPGPNAHVSDVPSDFWFCGARVPGQCLYWACPPAMLFGRPPALRSPSSAEAVHTVVASPGKRNLYPDRTMLRSQPGPGASSFTTVPTCPALSSGLPRASAQLPLPAFLPVSWPLEPRAGHRTAAAV